MTNEISARCRKCGDSFTIDYTENAGTDDSAELCPSCDVDVPWLPIMLWSEDEEHDAQAEES